jgi:hypothetical protein
MTMMRKTRTIHVTTLGGGLAALVLAFTLLAAPPVAAAPAAPHALVGPVVAAGKTCQVYTGCLKTTTRLRFARKVPAGSRVSLCAKTVVRGSTVLPRGAVKISIRRKSGGFTMVRTVAYDGGSRCLRTAPLRRVGTYVVRAKFTSPASSVFLNSARKQTFRAGG